MSENKICPECGSTETIERGFTPSGSQRFLCAHCRHLWTPDPKRKGRKTKAVIKAHVSLYEEHVKIIERFPGKTWPDKIRASIKSIHCAG